ncbi:MAG: hypothetical protein AB7O99_04110 [Dongiaceae bacterium]
MGTKIKCDLENPDSYLPLIEASLAGDSAAQEVLFNEMERFFHAVFRQNILDFEDRRDFIQDLFLELHQSGLKAYNPKKGRFIAFLMLLSKRRLIDKYRRQKNKKMKALPDCDIAGASSPFQESEESLQAKLTMLLEKFVTKDFNWLRAYIELVQQAPFIKGELFSRASRVLGVPRGSLVCAVFRSRRALSESGISPRTFWDFKTPPVPQTRGLLGRRRLEEIIVKTQEH